jgi:hypothetical protein
MKILRNYCAENHSDVETLFKLVESTKLRIARDQSFLRKFFRYEISETFTIAEKRDIFLYFLEYFSDSQRKLDSRINASYMIVYPMLVQAHQRNELRQVLSEEVVARYIEFIKRQ